MTTNLDCFTQWVAQATEVRQHVRGHIQYYGVSGNSRALRRYVYLVSRMLFKWLNRRSQRRSLTWSRYARGLDRWMPKPRIVHRFVPETANDSPGSPDGVTLQVRF